MILISEKENKDEKYGEERRSREFTKGFKMERRKKAGLVLSGIGGTIYLLGSSVLGGSIRFSDIGFLLFILTGVISLIGMGIGVKKIKIGGKIILISIPLPLVIGFIYGTNNVYGYIMGFLLLSQPHFVFVIIGGIVCLKSSDTIIEKIPKEKLKIVFKKMRASKKGGLILSGIGGILYLINGIMLFIRGILPYYLLNIPILAVGITSLIGIGIGTRNI
ncbi:unnamed protein product, partial [marine sediment metagenome]